MTDAPRKAYWLLTGPDTAEFCLRNSGALRDGYRLWGAPVMTLGPDGMVVGQAVVLPEYLEAPKAES
ncbi:hypothetical protein BAL199_26187 [alpha proteobacterium BAL199]|jgi:hypothetical protein|nr:hypothetical protein BAL199_26187 [alpha proteobacterium BAL199]